MATTDKAAIYPPAFAAILPEVKHIKGKMVHRLWKQAQLQVRRPKRRRSRPERPAVLAATVPNHIWAYDFLEDWDAQRRIMRILTVMDEFTREGLALDVGTITSSARVVGVLTAVVAVYGAPTYVRSDNGAEFVAIGLQFWLRKRGIEPLYIDPSSPWQNGKDERFNGTVRDECLNLHLFASVAEAQVRLEAFRQHFNDKRPHSRLGYQTPSEFRRAWTESQVDRPDSNIST